MKITQLIEVDTDYEGCKDKDALDALYESARQEMEERLALDREIH